MEKESLWSATFSVLETILTDVNIGEVDIEKVQNATKTISVLKRENIKVDPEKEKEVVSLLCIYLKKKKFEESSTTNFEFFLDIFFYP